MSGVEGAYTIDAANLAAAHLNHPIRFNTEIGAGRVRATINGELRSITHTGDEVQLKVANPSAVKKTRDHWIGSNTTDSTKFTVPPGRVIVVTG